jgi:hypothetical protein
MRLVLLFTNRRLEQQLCQGGAFAIGNHPSDYVTAVDINDGVELEIAPFFGPVQLGDIPGPTWFGAVAHSSGFTYAGQSPPTTTTGR